jgi:hypothetical protein
MAMAYRDDQRVEVSEQVLSRLLDGETVLLDLASGTYFGLEEVGSVIWEVLGQGGTVAEARARVLAEFEVDPETAGRDLCDLLAELERRGLVVVR